jgi:hypothetical protein
MQARQASAHDKHSRMQASICGSACRVQWSAQAWQVTTHSVHGCRHPRVGSGARPRVVAIVDLLLGCSSVGPNQDGAGGSGGQGDDQARAEEQRRSCRQRRHPDQGDQSGRGRCHDEEGHAKEHPRPDRVRLSPGGLTPERLIRDAI